MCMQKIDESLKEPERYITHTSEDCLYLNIFAPTPVYFYANYSVKFLSDIHLAIYLCYSSQRKNYRTVLGD